MKLSELELSKAICIMAYGVPKVGKSHFAASACAAMRCVVFTNRNGLATYVGAEVRKQFPTLDPSTIEIKLIDRDASLAAVKAFQNMNDTCRDLFEKELSSFDCIIIDDSTFTRTQARNMAILINGNFDRSETLVKEIARSKGSFTAAAPAAIQDQGKEMELMFSFLDELSATCRRYNKHLIVLAHEAQIYVDSKKKKESDIPQKDIITADFTGRKNPQANSTHFDIVMRLTREGKEGSAHVRFQCRPDGLVDCGDRYGVLDKFEKNLTWTVLEEKVKKQVAASSKLVEEVKK